ncbi:hypothetical protein BD560DRAFT_451367 [Blakeslea trispora]|nr:hypothetical protein BD560DRAFT_451367 [Blakeslea trispora]
MLTKELTPNAKAVNIIRPISQRTQQRSDDSHLFRHQQSNNNTFSASADSSSFTLSAAPTVNTLYSNTALTSSPMIRQPSAESNPGLSFFCQSPTSNNHNIITKNQQFKNTPVETTPTAQTQQPKQPLVISRISLSNFNQNRRSLSPPPLPNTVRRRVISTADNDGITTLDDVEYDDDDDEDLIDELDDIEDSLDSDPEDKAASPLPQQQLRRTPSSYNPLFGMMGGGLGSFLLRGPMATQAKTQADEARVHRKIEDLEIEKKSLMTLNQTLETVVKEQSDTISNLQNKLAAIERPLTPGLDSSLSKNGIMSSSMTDLGIMDSSELEKCLQDEDAAFERIHSVLVDLIDQAQAAVCENERKLQDYEVIAHVKGNNNIASSNTLRRSNNLYNSRPKSVIVTSSRNSTVGISNQQKNRVTRRISLGNLNNQVDDTSSNNTRGFSVSSTSKQSPATSPIPNRRYSMQRSVSRTSSVASSPNGSLHSIQNSTTANRASKYKNKLSDSQSTVRKWLN